MFDSCNLLALFNGVLNYIVKIFVILFNGNNLLNIFASSHSLLTVKFLRINSIAVHQRNYGVTSSELIQISYPMLCGPWANTPSHPSLARATLQLPLTESKRIRRTSNNLHNNLCKDQVREYWPQRRQISSTHRLIEVLLVIRIDQARLVT